MKRRMKKLKKLVVLLLIVFVAGGVFINSSFVTQKQAETYSQLVEKYGVSQTEVEEIKEEAKEEIKQEEPEIQTSYNYLDCSSAALFSIAPTKKPTITPTPIPKEVPKTEPSKPATIIKKEEEVPKAEVKPSQTNPNTGNVNQLQMDYNYQIMNNYYPYMAPNYYYQYQGRGMNDYYTNYANYANMNYMMYTQMMQQQMYRNNYYKQRQNNFPTKENFQQSMNQPKIEEKPKEEIPK